MHNDNPYASPEIADEPDLPAYEWCVSGLDLLVRDKVTLPLIDLETDGDPTPLVKETLKHTVSHPLEPVLLFISIASVPALRFLFGPNSHDPWTPIFAGLLVLIPASLIRKFWLKSHLFTIHFYRPSALRKTDKRHRLLIGTSLPAAILLLSVVPILILSKNFPIPLLYLSFFSGCCLLGITIFAIVLQKRQPRIIPANGPEGWLRIRNIRPTTLQRLREMESVRNHSTSAFVTRTTP